MFTGIVTHRGRLLETQATGGGGRRFVLAPEPALEGVGVGDSIAVDGVCLTVAGVSGDGGLRFDVVPETVRRSTLGRLGTGERVNLERSLRLGDDLGGHWVQGHVEGTARVEAVERRGEDVRMVLAVDEHLFGGLLEKGSVALDGVSMTVGEVWREPGDGGGGRFAVYVIPHTLAVTSLGERRPGQEVNMEPDVLGRWVERHVRRILGGGEEGTPAPAGGKGGTP